MDKNTITGFLLIFLLIFGYQYVMQPSEAEIARQQAMQDSLQLVEEQKLEQLNAPENKPQENYTQDSTTLAQLDSLQKLQQLTQFGLFAPFATGEEKFEVLENDFFKIIFSNKGGRITEVLLKKYHKLVLDTTSKEEHKLPLKLLEDEKNRFEYKLPVNGASKTVSTSDLYFNARLSDSTLTFRAEVEPGQFFEQVYSINYKGYEIDYTINYGGIGTLYERDAESVELKWVNFLDRIEQNTQYEGTMSSIYFKEKEEDPDWCSCTGDDKEELGGRPIKWVANSNQFFETALIAKEGTFNGAVMETVGMQPEDENLKKLDSEIFLPFGEEESFEMDLYIGPKDFETLQAYNNDLEYTVPFGSSIFGTINRWIIRPLFNFLSSFISNHGIVILVLTLIVKMLLYPLTYKMVRSQSKMAALKPQMAAMKEKHKNDSQKAQMETMKLYQEFGVNPLGGCMPMVLQMPIWFALYRFFPSAIEFRQASFLWATDLSSFDVAFWLPWDIPAYGMHVSLFTLLWASTTVVYTMYNMKHMDMSAGMGGANQKMMKYMQYGMPVMFLFFFNNFAAGLTCYLFFSNVINVSQMVITKNYIIDKDKIKAELDAYKKKPKKKGGFQSRLQEAMKEQQKIQAEREKAKSNRSRKKR